MYYVIVDLEWNQYHNPMWTPTARNGVVMHEEIIQIGAVKTDETMTPVDTFNIFVRLGGRRRLDRYVKKLTGINEHDIASGEDFPVAAEMFAAWIKDADAIFSWGQDDRRVFLNNLSFHNIEAPACAWYDAQRIYASQNPSHGGLALKNCAEECGIRVKLSLHNALNDAVLTSACMAKLDMEKGLREYEKPRKQSSSGSLAPIASAHTHRHNTRRGAWEEACSSLLHCPRCMQALKWTSEERGSMDRFYKNAACPEHGEFIIRGEFQGIKTQVLKLSFFENDEQTRQMVEQELNPVKKSRRRRRAKKNADTVEVVSTEDMLSKAIAFAADAHKEQLLEPGTSPYIVHPMEAAAIASTMTDDTALIAAAVLHDVLTMRPDISADTLRAKFGDHIASLVESEASSSISLDGSSALSEDTSEEELIILLSDMLSGLRAIYRSHEAGGEAFWEKMGPEFKAAFAARSKSMLKALKPLSAFSAYKEYSRLVSALFAKPRKTKEKTPKHE